MHQKFAPVAAGDSETFLAGHEVQGALPGDFILTHGNAWTSKLIRIGQRLRFWGADRKFARWNHAAIFVDATGSIVEALGAGVEQRNISVYKDTEYTVVRVANVAHDPNDRQEAAAFALWSRGQPYGWLTIVSIIFGLVTGGKFTFAFDGQTICSGLVARSLERTAAIFNRTPSHIMPADLAKYFEVQPPPPGTPKGVIPKHNHRWSRTTAATSSPKTS